MFTFLRIPVERVRSEVLHLYRVVGRQLRLPEGSVSLEDAINRDLLEDNLQTRMIAGVSKYAVPTLGDEHFRKAQDVLGERFDFVGTLERMESDFRRLAKMLMLEGKKLRKDNVRPETVTPIEQEILDRIDWPLVEERHRVDNKLYEWVRDNWSDETRADSRSISSNRSAT
jgi:hypothetical protein